MDITTLPLKASLETSKSEHQIKENHKWSKFNTNITDLGSTKLNVKYGKTLNHETLNGGSTVFTNF
jgi:hypothetical protein